MSDSLIKKKYFSRRLFVFSILRFFILILFSSRMYFLQIINGKKYSNLANENRSRTFFKRPIRGLIIDGFGLAVAENSIGYRVLIDAKKADVELDGVIKKIESLLNRKIDNALINKILLKKSGIYILYRHISWDELSQIEIYAPNLKGISVHSFYYRYYNFSKSCAHVVGYLREETVVENKRELKMNVGISGVELFYNKKLMGTPSVSTNEVNAKGDRFRELSRTDGLDGLDVQITINAQLQDEVYKLLNNRRGSVVILDIEFGDILVLCSSPSYDSNQFIRGFSDTEWKNLSKDKRLPLLNRAVALPIQPASTFKPVISIAALEAGIITPDTKIKCEGQISFGGRVFKCWKHKGHGYLNVHDALVNSCNVFFYEIAKSIDLDFLMQVANKFSFGELFDIGLGIESAGILPNKKWRYDNIIVWNLGDTMNIGIGQGMISTSILNLAVQAGRLATGKIVVPRLTFDKINKFQDMNFQQEYFSIVRDAMFNVVNRGTASRSIGLHRYKLLDIAGKTGTVQNSSLASDHGLFMAYYPYSKPKYAAAVFLENSGGSGSAVRLFRDIMSLFKEHYPMILE